MPRRFDRNLSSRQRTMDARAQVKSQTELISRIDLRPAVLFFWLLPVLVIFTAPPTRHAVVVDLASSSFFQLFDSEEEERRTNYRDSIDVVPITNELRVAADDHILWNGEPINQAGLFKLLRESMMITPEPILVFEPDPLASYDMSARVIAMVKHVGVVKFEFGGLEQHCYFEKSWGSYSSTADHSSLAIATALHVGADVTFQLPYHRLPKHEEICSEGGRYEQ
ncbi:MAG: hypothetical protein AAGK02_02810 [Pseudomonadota bacterium]